MSEESNAMIKLAEIMLEPRLSGIPQTLITPMTRLGYFPDYGKDVPGLGDDIAAALETNQGIAYGVNGKEHGGLPRVKRWDEYFYDLSISNAVGDYFNLPIRFINEAWAAKTKTLKKVENMIEKYNKEHPINEKLIDAAIQKAREENMNELALYMSALQYVPEDQRIDYINGEIIPRLT